MVAADAAVAVAAACFSIPVGMPSFVRQRQLRAIKGVALLFSAFIFAFGITHVLDVYTFWQPDHALQALSKAVSAAVSFLTAMMRRRSIPSALKLPTIEGLQSTVASLEAEIARRREAERQVVDVRQRLAVTLTVTLASIGAGILATGRAAQVSRSNDVAEQVLGCRQAEAKGRSLWRVLEREDRPAAHFRRNPVHLLIEQGVGVEGVHRVVAIARHGRRSEVDLQAAVSRHPNGPVSGLALVLRDMTRLAPAEAARILSASSQGHPIAPLDTVRLTQSGERLDVLISMS